MSKHTQLNGKHTVLLYEIDIEHIEFYDSFSIYGFFFEEKYIQIPTTTQTWTQQHMFWAEDFFLLLKSVWFWHAFFRVE